MSEKRGSTERVRSEAAYTTEDKSLEEVRKDVASGDPDAVNSGEVAVMENKAANQSKTANSPTGNVTVEYDTVGCKYYAVKEGKKSERGYLTSQQARYHALEDLD